ncbi:NucA/NucB deoxyribonuclease domain-containing protein [Kitasatospora sp. NPDC001175]|uniref:NucA/NucB deoxyribonuclease domain-containing protein n=1 Tax=Kitasatospora sp. NPDC001175 TaxID=3157103 RepID=UPI003CFFD1A4
MALVFSVGAIPAEADDSVAPDSGYSIAEADSNAPDIDFFAQDPDEDPGGGVQVRQEIMPDCPQAQARPDGSYLCIKLGNPIEHALPQNSLGGISMPWCDNRATTGFTRFEGCIKWARPMEVWLFKLAPTVPLGHATFLAEQRIKLSYDSVNWDTSLTLVPTQIDQPVTPLTLSFRADCAPQCQAISQRWVGTRGEPVSQTWTSETDVHAATVYQSLGWTGSATRNSHDEIDVAYTMSGMTPVAQAPASISFGNRLATVRCDNQVGKTAGCAFRRIAPTFTVNGAKYPQAQAFYGLEQAYFGSGLKQLKKTLRKDSKNGSANRAKLCNSTFRPDPDVPDTSCDEYPFAVTQESGNGVTGGEDCLQFTTYRGSHGQLVVGSDERYPFAPSSTAQCGRANIELTQNSGAGGDLGRFTQSMRLFDDDEYYVESNAKRFMSGGKLRHIPDRDAFNGAKIVHLTTQPTPGMPSMVSSASIYIPAGNYRWSWKLIIPNTGNNSVPGSFISEDIHIAAGWYAWNDVLMPKSGTYRYSGSLSSPQNLYEPASMEFSVPADGEYWMEGELAPV